MKTMLRLAKRSETPYTGKLIYLENENRKIVFSSGDNYASIFAVGNYFGVGESNTKKSYQTHSTLKDATTFRRAAGAGRGIITIDKQGFIYDLDLTNRESELVNSGDMVALSPTSFLGGYQNIADTYALVLNAEAYVKASDTMTDSDKARAHQLKELAYKVITLFKHTHELSVSTCIEFNDDFFNPNPVYAEKTLRRMMVISSKLADLAGHNEYADQYSGSQTQCDDIDKVINDAIGRAERDNMRHCVA